MQAKQWYFAVGTCLPGMVSRSLIPVYKLTAMKISVRLCPVTANPVRVGLPELN